MFRDFVMMHVVRQVVQGRLGCLPGDRRGGSLLPDIVQGVELGHEARGGGGGITEMKIREKEMRREKIVGGICTLLQDSASANQRGKDFCSMGPQGRVVLCPFGSTITSVQANRA